MESGELIKLVAEILEVESEKLSPTDRLDDIDWDSLSNLSFIAEIDERLGLNINADALAEAETVADLHRLVNTSAA